MGAQLPDISTYDDGSYHVWLSFGTASPNCNWLVRYARNAGGDARAPGSVERVVLSVPGGVYNPFYFTP